MSEWIGQTKPYKANNKFSQGDLVKVKSIPDRVFLISGLRMMGSSTRSGVEACGHKCDDYWYMLSDGSDRHSEELELAR